MSSVDEESGRVMQGWTVIAVVHRLGIGIRWLWLIGGGLWRWVRWRS